jgi:hypothetical protein
MMTTPVGRAHHGRMRTQQELIQENQSNTWEIANTTITRKFVNGCKSKSPISTAMEFLNSCQEEKNMFYVAK